MINYYLAFQDAIPDALRVAVADLDILCWADPPDDLDRQVARESAGLEIQSELAIYGKISEGKLGRAVATVLARLPGDAALYQESTVYVERRNGVLRFPTYLSDEFAQHFGPRSTLAGSSPTNHHTDGAIP